MGGNDARVSLPLLWTKPSTSDIYKTNESFYCATAATKHAPNNIPGGFAHNGYVSTVMIFHQHIVINLLQNLGFALNFKKSVLENRIFEDGALIPLGEACKTNATVRKSRREQRDYHHGSNKVNRETITNCPSSILAAFANPDIKTFEMLQCQSKFKTGRKGRTSLVVR